MIRVWLGIGYIDCYALYACGIRILILDVYLIFGYDHSIEGLFGLTCAKSEMLKGRVRNIFRHNTVI